MSTPIIKLTSSGDGTSTAPKIQLFGAIGSEEATLIEKEITANGVYPASEDGVDGYSKVIVNVEGSGGECSGEHVITVEELPTENIDKKAIYKCVADSPFTAIIINDEGNRIDFGALYEMYLGCKCEYYTVDTKPTTGIKVMDEVNKVWPFYFVKDENDIFICSGNPDTGEVEWAPGSVIFGDSSSAPIFGGCITDLAEAAMDGHYYALGSVVTEYFKYGDPDLVDVVVCQGSLTQAIGAQMSGLLYSTSKPTNDIKVSALDEGSFYIYYIEDENDLFMYGDVEGAGTNTWISLGLMFGDEGFTFKGAISSVSEVTGTGYYAIVTKSGFYKLIYENDVPAPTSEEKTVTPNTSIQEITPTSADYLSKVTVNAIPSNYIVPSGTVSITEPGTHDVKKYETANVAIPTVLTVFNIADVPANLPDGSVVYVIGGN